MLSPAIAYVHVVEKTHLYAMQSAMNLIHRTVLTPSPSRFTLRSVARTGQPSIAELAVCQSPCVGVLLIDATMVETAQRCRLGDIDTNGEQQQLWGSPTKGAVSNSL